MKLEMVTTETISSQIYESKFGAVYNLKNVQLFKGNYVIKDNKIPFSSIHEFANEKKWFIDRVSNSGELFGGKNENDLKITLPYLEIQETSTEVKQLEGNYYFFQYNWDFNYLHFLISSFSRLCAFSEIKKQNKDIKILVKSSTPQYQKDFIESIFPNELYNIDDSYDYDCENIYVMDFISHDGQKISEFYDSIQLKKIPQRSIYISRKDASQKRPLKNESELEQLASNYKYEELILSNYTIEEKAQLFSSVDKVLSTFGAGIANIVFCKTCKELIYINHPLYKVPDIIKDLCKVKKIKLLEVNTMNTKWMFLRILYKFLSLIGIKKHEWANDYSWNIDINKLEKIVKG